jgi:hypothetical protein
MARLAGSWTTTRTTFSELELSLPLNSFSLFSWTLSYCSALWSLGCGVKCPCMDHKEITDCHPCWSMIVGSLPRKCLSATSCRNPFPIITIKLLDFVHRPDFYKQFLRNHCSVKNAVFWDVTPEEILSSVHRLLVMANIPSSPILVTLMMEALSFYETSVLTRATWCNIPEDSILHSHCHENLKSYIKHSIVPVFNQHVTLCVCVFVCLLFSFICGWKYTILSCFLLACTYETALSPHLCTGKCNIFSLRYKYSILWLSICIS